MAKLVECKACGKEIAKGVKKCPSCGKDQRNWFGRHKVLTFIGAWVIIGTIAGALGSGGSEPASTKVGQVEQKAETVYKVGDVIKVKDLEYTVKKVEEKAQVGDRYSNKKASDGGTLVAIQYTVKNVGDKPVGTFSYPSVNLVDEKGTEYDTDIDASGYYAVETGVDNAKILSDLNPDITVTDTKVYEISKAKYDQGKWFIKIDDAKIQIK